MLRFQLDYPYSHLLGPSCVRPHQRLKPRPRFRIAMLVWRHPHLISFWAANNRCRHHITYHGGGPRTTSAFGFEIASNKDNNSENVARLFGDPDNDACVSKTMLYLSSFGKQGMMLMMAHATNEMRCLPTVP
jgi:hypothetical protein